MEECDRVLTAIGSAKEFSEPRSFQAGTDPDGNAADPRAESFVKESPRRRAGFGFGDFNASRKPAARRFNGDPFSQNCPGHGAPVP